MPLKLDHIAVAVADMKAAIHDFERLGLVCERVETVPTERSEVAFFDLGGVHLELVSPLAPDAPLARSIAQRGEGLHHICLEVEDIERSMTALKAAGLRLVKDEASPGAGGSRIVFVHPKAIHGVLIELVQKPPRV